MRRISDDSHDPGRKSAHRQAQAAPAAADRNLDPMAALPASSSRAGKAETLDVDAAVGFADAFLASLALFLRRSRTGLIACAVVCALAAAAIGLTGAYRLAWIFVAPAVAALLAVGFVARLTQMDFRARGGGPLRLHYHVCPSGMEATAGRRSGWLAWGDLWDAVETRRSFLICPSPQEQYVLPKRCFDERGIELLRGILAERRSGQAVD